MNNPGPGSRPSSRAHGNIPLAALRQANSRASIAGKFYFLNFLIRIVFIKN